MQGLVAVCQKNDLPSVRESSRLKAEEGKIYYLETAVLGGCALRLAQGEDLSTLSKGALQLALSA